MPLVASRVCELEDVVPQVWLYLSLKEATAQCPECACTSYKKGGGGGGLFVFFDSPPPSSLVFFDVRTASVDGQANAHGESWKLYPRGMHRDGFAA
jgi:hypothetical protein